MEVAGCEQVAELLEWLVTVQTWHRGRVRAKDPSEIKKNSKNKKIIKKLGI